MVNIYPACLQQSRADDVYGRDFKIDLSKSHEK